MLLRDHLRELLNRETKRHCGNQGNKGVLTRYDRGSGGERKKGPRYNAEPELLSIPRLDEAPRRIIRNPLWIGLASSGAKRYAGNHPLPGLDTRGDRFIVLAG